MLNYIVTIKQEGVAFLTPCRGERVNTVWYPPRAGIYGVERGGHVAFPRLLLFRLLMEVPHISREMLINEQIRDREIRVIDADGSQLGIMASREALRIAVEKNLDLVKIAPQATPPVCRIMDYGKFRFEQAKKDKEARRNQKIVAIKEIRMSLNIDTHDLETKVGHAVGFLKDGDKVKVTVRFRGREMAHTELGGSLLAKFSEACAEFASVEKQPKLEGRSMSLFLAPKQAK